MDAVTDLHDGVPYSYFAVAPEGGLVFTAGACYPDQLVEIEAVALRAA
jgi:hypothetical protein